jgi:copper chaperone CopZ
VLRGVEAADPAAPEAAAASRRVRLVVPGLPEAPVVGDGCCSFFPAEDALAEALGAWPGVLRVEVDVERGSIDLDLAPSSPALEDLVGTVSELGYRVEAVQRDGQGAWAGPR